MKEDYLSSYQILESECRVWRLQSLRSLDRLAQLAVFTGCSRGVVCFTSYRQTAQSEIFEARNSKYVNTVIILNLNIYYKQEKCALLGCYADSSVNFFRRFETTYRSIFKCILALSDNLLPMIQDILSVIRSTVFLPLMLIYYRRFGRTYRSYLQVSFAP
jgi:hypothetical protein